MTQKFSEGTKVEWNWGSGTAEGTVRESFTERVERRIAGNNVVRNASDENPAYLIEQEDGDRVLKSHSELRKAD